MIQSEVLSHSSLLRLGLYLRHVVLVDLYGERAVGERPRICGMVAVVLDAPGSVSIIAGQRATLLTATSAIVGITPATWATASAIDRDAYPCDIRWLS